MTKTKHIQQIIDNNRLEGIVMTQRHEDLTSMVVVGFLCLRQKGFIIKNPGISVKRIPLIDSLEPFYGDDLVARDKAVDWVAHEMESSTWSELKTTVKFLSNSGYLAYCLALARKILHKFTPNWEE